MGLKSRSLKGEISIQNNNGRIRLRWRYAGKRYSLNLPYPYLPENLLFSNLKIAEIKLDELTGLFDTSLNKYKPNSSQAGKCKEPPLTILTHQANENVNEELCLRDLGNEFWYWTKNIKNINLDQSHDYLYTGKLLEKWGNIPVDGIAAKLNVEPWMPTTYNRRIACLFNFFDWLGKKGIISHNPLDDVRRKRN